MNKRDQRILIKRERKTRKLPIMDTKIEKVFIEILETYGLDVINNSRKCEGLLRDLCGESKREINLLIFSLKEGIPFDFLNEQGQIPTELLTNRLVKRLVDNLALEELAAKWAVSCCLYALKQVNTKKS